MVTEVNGEVGRFINLDYKPIKFELFENTPPSSTDPGIYSIGFDIREVDLAGNYLPDSSNLHVFKFGWRWRSYEFHKSRDLPHFINCLKDMVLDGSYRCDNPNEAIIHSVLEDKPSDIYIERFKNNPSNQGIIYNRPPENLARERILLRSAVIKAIYGQGNWVKWNDLMKLVPIEPAGILRQTCDYLESANLLDQFELNKYKLAASGYSFFEKRILPSTNTVFIIASCDEKHKKWVDHYKKEISAVGLKPYFQEKEEPPREIIIEIYEQIRNCAFVLADLTGGSENCLYELGYAHALGKKIILVRDNADVRKEGDERVRLTFDLNQFRHSFRFDEEDWESDKNIEFREELGDRIQKVKTDLFETQFFTDITNT